MISSGELLRYFSVIVDLSREEKSKVVQYCQLVQLAYLAEAITGRFFHSIILINNN